MPPFKKIETLTNICTEWVWRWLYHCLNHLALPKDRLIQRQYVLSTLNPNIRQNLLNSILSMHMYQVDLNCKCKLLELLGDRSTKCIDLTNSGFAYIEEVFQLYRTLTVGMLIGLTKFGVICNVRSKNDSLYLKDINSTFYRVLNQMHNLKWVSMNGCADTTILSMLGSNCHQLEYLNINGSIRVDDEAIANLLVKSLVDTEDKFLEQDSYKELPTNPCCDKLQFVCISETRVSTFSALMLLHYVPNLTSLGGFLESGSICEVIRKLQPDTGLKQFKLNQMWESKMLPQQASLLSKACPNITKLRTDKSSMPALEFLHPVESLSLELCFRDCADEIYKYLEVRGEHLKELILFDNINCALSLAWLVELTPNLEIITARVFHEDGYDIPDWKVMRVAKVTVDSSKTLFGLLTHATSITDLTIIFSPEPYTETFECINDSLVISIVTSGGLKCLKKLNIKENAISLKGIDCLFLHCSDLSYLSQLLYWEKISQEDVKTLREQISQNNWQLELVLRDDTPPRCTFERL